jgi:carbon storage regulator
MLVLSRKVGEGVQIGDQITVTIVRIAGGGVRIGIDAPADMAIAREELIREKSAEESPSAEASEPALSRQ